MRSETKSFFINPYIAGSPVKNPAMFFGRDDVYAWLRRHLRGRYQDNVIVLYGERRSGKTSVLYQMEEHLGDETYVPVLIDFQSMGLEGIDGFLWEVARKTVLALRGVEGLSLLDRPARRDFEENARHHFEEIFLPPILAALGQRHLLLMFDETNRLEEKIAAGDLPPETVNYLRSFIQKQDRINFIFSIGSRVEEAQRLSFELFNLAVYRKISFLEQDFAADLITKPVDQYYTYTDAAIDRIFELTSGQPYYTQLLCHNLFSYWAEYKLEQLGVEEVEAVLSDVIEQATPNLQFVWDDSPPVEKAILAALAAKLPEYRAGVMRRNLDRALRQAELYPPVGDVTTGLKRLFERDVITRQEPYRFRVGFLELWLTEFKPLDWVYEELGEVAAQWKAREQKRKAEAPTRVEQARRWAAPVLAGVVIGGLIALSVFWYAIPQPSFDPTKLDEALTREAQLQAELSASQTEVARADTIGDRQQAEARATATAAEAATIQAAVTEALVSEATKIARDIEAAQTQEAIAQATISSGRSGLAAISLIVTPTTTSTFTPAPTDTPTPLPTPTVTATETPVPTATSTPSATPIPTATATSGPQGRLAIPVDNGVGGYTVRIFSVTTGEVLAEIPQASQPRFNKAGDKLAVTARRGDSESIWIYNSDGSLDRQASALSPANRAAWAPDGQQLAYENQTVPKDGDLGWRIFVQDEIVQPTTLDVSMLAGDILDEDRPLYPLWADDGQILFSACNYWGSNAGSRCGIWRTKASATINGDGFQLPENVTGEREIPTDTAGDRLLMMGERNRTWEVFLGTLQGGTLVNLSNHAANDGLAVFSPDGVWVAFISDRERAWGVWVVPTRGGNAVRLPIEGLGFVSGERNWTTERIAWGP